MEAVDPKKKPAAKGKGKAKEVEVEAPPPPPEDAPGWEALYSVFVELVERVKAYDEWRQRVKVVQPLGSQLSAGAARTEAAAGSEADAGGEASVAPEGTAAAGKARQAARGADRDRGSFQCGTVRLWCARAAYMRRTRKSKRLASVR